MKSRILIVGFLFFFSLANAQIKLGLVAGLNMSTEVTTFKGSGIAKSNDMKNQSGLLIGPTIQLMYPKMDIGLELTTLYSRKGSNFGYSLDSILLEGYRNVDYMEVPICVIWKFGPEDFKGFVSAGYVFGYAFSGKYAVEKAENQETGASIPSLLSSGKMNLDGKANAFNNTDHGYVVGGGIEIFQSFEFGIYYTYCTTSFANDKAIEQMFSADPAYASVASSGAYKIDAHNSTLSLRLKYLF